MNSTLEAILELTKVGGAFIIVGAGFYGVAHTTYQTYTKYVIDKIIKNYEEEKKNKINPQKSN